MTTYEKWKYFYNRGWAKKEHLQMVVQYGGLTVEEYEQITGEPYAA